MAIKEFEENDIFFNIMKTKPHNKFSIFNGSIYYKAEFSNEVEAGFTALNDLNLGITVSSGCTNTMNFSEECATQYIPLV